MTGQIIHIDKDTCNGCGLCVSACHQGAIGLADGKATLLREDYCDGLGMCLPVCPTGAISFERQEAPAVDTTPRSCPGARVTTHSQTHLQAQAAPVPTHLNQWPVQIKLVPVNAPYFQHAHLLVAADCAAYAYGNFHAEYMRDKVTIIGCPKLDEGDYAEKLTAILAQNEVRSVTVARMEVPCCSGLEHAVDTAVEHCGRPVVREVVTISIDGRVVG